MILASFSVIAAGVLEIVRKEYPMTSQIIANHSFNASSVSVFAQIPQFTLFGASEVFTSVSGMFNTIKQKIKYMCSVINKNRS